MIKKAKMNMIPKSDIAIVIISCDKYKDLWKPFFHCFFKYWSDCPYSIILATNNLIFDDKRVITINYGADQDYSTNVISVISQVESDWIILWFEDAFITSKLDNNRITKILEKAIIQDVGYLKLTNDFPLVYSSFQKQEFDIIPKGVKYRSAIGMALYKKETLLKLLPVGKNAWELDKSNQSNALNDKFCALTADNYNNPPIKVINSVIKGKWNLDAIKFLKNEGLGVYLSNRSKQSLWQYFYIKLYGFRLNIYRILKIYWTE